MCFSILNTFAKFHWDWLKNDRFWSKKVIFRHFDPPLWRHKGGQFRPKYTKICVFPFFTALPSFIEISRKMSENHFFCPKSIIFQPIPMKLGKNVENGKPRILVYFGRNWPPLWHHNEFQNIQKQLFSTEINNSLTIFNETWKKNC